MSKKTIIYITCAVTITLIIAFAVYFTITANKPGNLEVEAETKIIIEKYDENFNIERTIEITDTKQIKELEKICENPSLEQDDTSPYLAIRNDIKLDLGNGTFFMMQEDLNEYCYYENANSNTKLVIKMPEGLLEKVNEILK